jgi:hypothetical protein
MFLGILPAMGFFDSLVMPMNTTLTTNLGVTKYG